MNFSRPQVNKKQAKLRWTTEEKQYLLQNCKEISISDIAVMLKKTVEQCKNQARLLSCGYISK